MKQLFRYSMMLAVMVMAVLTFTACGSDDKDDLPDGYVKTTEGVHRIEVSFDGNTTGWNCDATFIATYGTATVNLYENGKQVGSAYGYSSSEVRDYAIETDAKCDLMSVTVILSHSSFASVEPITVTLKGYVNGKQTNMKVVEVPTSETNKGIVFSAEEIGGDLI